MSVRLANLLVQSAVDAPELRNLRDIDNHYHLTMLADSMDEVAQYQAEISEFTAHSVAVQAAAAAVTHLDLVQIAVGVDGVKNALTVVGESAARSERALSDIEDQLSGWLPDISERLRTQQELMAEIADSLKRPLEMEVLEMRRNADYAIKSGMAVTDADRDQWYRDAMELIERAIDSPIGKLDYVSWFQLGWLVWKLDGDLDRAAASFERASRLSLSARDQYYGESIRHLAYMRYLAGDTPRAWADIEVELGESASAAMLFDGARYAAASGLVDEAFTLLARAIRLHPPLMLTALAETDFSDMSDRLDQLFRQLREEADSATRSVLHRWAKALKCLKEAEKRAGPPVHIEVPAALNAAKLRSLADSMSSCSCLGLLQIADEYDGAAATLLDLGQGILVLPCLSSRYNL